MDFSISIQKNHYKQNKKTFAFENELSRSAEGLSSSYSVMNEL